MDIVVYLLFALGLVLIIKGGDWFVDSAVWIAEVTGIPSIIIGATIVSIATTLPELIVSVTANLQGSSEMAIGNAIGSIICNIGLISSLGYILLKNKIKKSLFLRKSLIMIGALVVFTLFSLDLTFSHLEAGIVLLFIVLYLYYNIKGSKESDEEYTFDKNTLTVKMISKNIMMFVAGAGGIILGASLLVDNGQIIAKQLGVPEAIISLTLIALGTSLPELTTMISSIKKGNQDIGLGNIIGANILNVALILTSSSLISSNGLPIMKYDFSLFGKSFVGFPNTLFIDVPFALLLMVLFAVPTYFKGETKKWQGFAMLTTYVLYLVLRVSTGIS
ncbi:calcium/sodium antiporter [Acidaminobacter sp. JC074]|uniref:calcium/sodium antiporter n=1 Tax=Acidaminobacter sp. JC074 TaxID=2530199 RepID=UPI001F10F8B8|nr:calcium/sodium antiporter [Acidaminobacter sp. JC074]MCH4886670.1 calcium/sodium antiporter [Acidaminobacter sp. JC074]